MTQEKEITEMFDQISPTYDQVNSILSFGLDRYWRRCLLKQIPSHAEIKLLDIATGTGEVALTAVKRKKVHKAVGVDLATKMLQIAEIKAKKMKLETQLQFQEANALSLPFQENEFECASISFGIRNVQDVLLGLKEIHRVLKPQGRALILEFSQPTNPFLKKCYLLYLRHLLPKIGGAVSKSGSSYVYLNKTIESFPYGDTFLDLMRKAGFKSPKCKPLLGGIVTLYSADKC